MLRHATVVVFATSTYGPGAPPSSANKFLSWLGCSPAAAQLFQHKPTAVLGFGDSSYPRFCAAADTLAARLLSLDCEMLMQVTKADALAQEELTVWYVVA